MRFLDNVRKKLFKPGLLMYWIETVSFLCMPYCLTWVVLYAWNSHSHYFDAYTKLFLVVVFCLQKVFQLLYNALGPTTKQPIDFTVNKFTTFQNKAKFIKGKTVAEANQGEFNFAFGAMYIGTCRVWQCTLFTGWCNELSLAFICHVDTPHCARGMPDFLKALNGEIIHAAESLGIDPDQKFQFDCQLFGGQAYWTYPFLTRIEIKRALRDRKDLQPNVEFDVTEHAMPFSLKHFAVSLSSANGEYDGYAKCIGGGRQSWKLYRRECKVLTEVV